MKEFEKWEEGECCKDFPIECRTNISGCKDCHRLHKEGWKAALGWVLTEICELRICEEACTLEIGEFIQKELEED